MKEITIKQVLDKNGDFSYFELHQGDNVVELSFTLPGSSTHNQLYKWEVLKKTIDKMADNLILYAIKKNPNEQS